MKPEIEKFDFLRVHQLITTDTNLQSFLLIRPDAPHPAAALKYQLTPGSLMIY